METAELYRSGKLIGKRQAGRFACGVTNKVARSSLCRHRQDQTSSAAVVCQPVSIRGVEWGRRARFNRRARRGAPRRSRRWLRSTRHGAKVCGRKRSAQERARSARVTFCPLVEARPDFDGPGMMLDTLSAKRAAECDIQPARRHECVVGRERSNSARCGRCEEERINKINDRRGLASRWRRSSGQRRTRWPG